MKKEVLVAILMGMILGLVITFGIYQARNSLVPNATLSPLEGSPIPSPETANNAGSLVITSPEDQTITNNQEVTVAGTTQADSFVGITINDQAHLTTADSSGNFSIQDNLEDGSNVIQVLSINSDGEAVHQEITVIYTTESLVDESQETATDSAQANQ